MRREEAGFTLAESLISASLLLLGLVLALTAYDTGRRLLERSENLAEQQQAVRTALDQLVSHLRGAGRGVNPDGDPARPDEGIEAALDTAIAIRGDFDGTDPAEAGTPEASLAGAAFATVPTGNDEIVVYALEKGDGSDSGAMSFTADVREAQRNGTTETVTITGITLAPALPPYTLYRITLNNDSTKWGSAAFLVRAPVLDNVVSLTFHYYDAAGVLLPDDTALSRSRIRRIEVDLVVMTREGEPGFSDPADPNPATHAHRKLHRTIEVTPRSLGWAGAPDLEASLGS